MSRSPLKSSELKKVDQIQENLIAYFRIFAGLPGTTFVEEAVTWCVGHPGNQVLRNQIPAEAADRRIDELLNRAGAQTSQIDWFVFPGCRPADLGQRLAARGQAGGPDGTWTLVGKIGGPGGTWMLANLTTLPEPPPVADSFYIKYVDSLGMLDAWQKISAAGFGAADYEHFYRAYARHGFGPEAFSLHYIGYLDETPVTSSTLLLAGGIAGIYDISTPPALRRQGFGSAITWAMMKEARQRGYDYAYIWSSPMGKGVYSRVGFVAADFGIREYQWKRRGEADG